LNKKIEKVLLLSAFSVLATQYASSSAIRVMKKRQSTLCHSSHTLLNPFSVFHSNWNTT